MAVGPVIAVRAFQRLKRTLLYCAGKLPRGWFHEQLKTLKSDELATLVDNLDRQASVDQTSSMRQEHTDAYALQRDVTYANRSRRWLYTRAMASRIDHDYEAWLAVVRANMQINLEKFPKTDPDTLAEQSVAELMEIKNPV